MSKAMVVVLAASLFLAASAPPAVSQEGAADDGAARLVKEMAALNESMREAVALMRAHLEAQKMQLLMRRIEIRHQGLIGLEEELRKNIGERNSVTEELDQLQLSMGTLDQRIEDEAGLPQGGEWRLMRGEMEVRIKVLKDRQYRLDQKVIDLENELNDRRAEIEEWEEAIDAALDQK
jgi:hypothetical protein